MERLDKFLCDCGVGTRSQVKVLLKSGAVTVDGVPVSREELVPESEEETCNRFLIGNGAFITL